MIAFPSPAYASFVSILGAADAGTLDATCPSAKNLYVLAGQYAASMMSKGYDQSPPPADRPQKLKIANDMFERAEIACHTESPAPGPKPPPQPTPVPAAAGLSLPVMGAIALGAYFLLFRKGR
jgi:hypothetical protein